MEEYSSALDGVNNVLDTTGFSLNNLRQMSGCNSESLKEQVESLKVVVTCQHRSITVHLITAEIRIGRDKDKNWMRN